VQRMYIPSFPCNLTKSSFDIGLPAKSVVDLASPLTGSGFGGSVLVNASRTAASVIVLLRRLGAELYRSSPDRLLIELVSDELSFRVQGNSRSISPDPSPTGISSESNQFSPLQRQIVAEFQDAAYHQPQTQIPLNYMFDYMQTCPFRTYEVPSESLLRAASCSSPALLRPETSPLIILSKGFRKTTIMYKPALEPRRCVQEVELIQRRYASKSLTATDLWQTTDSGGASRIGTRALDSPLHSVTIASITKYHHLALRYWIVAQLGSPGIQGQHSQPTRYKLEETKETETC
jgi:hypothetical protein